MDPGGWRESEMARREPSPLSPPSETNGDSFLRSLVGKARAIISRVLRFRPRAPRAPEAQGTSRRCPSCKTGQRAAARISTPLRKGQIACIVTGVPAQVCLGCGKYTLDPLVAHRVEEIRAHDVRCASPTGMAHIAYRQRRVRVNLVGSLQGPRELHSAVLILNLSPEGALIAHAVRLSPADACTLWLQLDEMQLPLGARVIWSVPRPAASAAGAGDLPSQSGLHFPDLPEAVKAQIGRYLATPSSWKKHPGHRAK